MILYYKLLGAVGLSGRRLFLPEINMEMVHVYLKHIRELYKKDPIGNDYKIRVLQDAMSRVLLYKEVI